MTRICACLLTSAATVLSFASGGQAIAQTSYQAGSGSPQSSATYTRGPSLPDLSPDQIAADVVIEYNRRTGAPEAVGPTFDPFEQDEDLAGSASLRTMDHARDLNGTPLQDGVLLDVQLYYTDFGDREIGRTRDALFLSGESVPVVLSDSRELECSSRVTETIYHYDSYYTPGYGGLYRPRPRYFGHSLFDIHVWGGGYPAYGGWNRGYRGHRGYRDFPRTYRPTRPARPHRPVRPRPHRPSRVDRRPQDRLPPRELTRTVPGTTPPRSRVDHFINGRPAGSHDKYRGIDTDRRPDRQPRRTDRRRDRLPDTVVPGRGSAMETSRPSRRERERRERVSVPSPLVSPPPRREAPPARTQPRQDISPPRRQTDRTTTKPIQHNMFPNDRPRDGVVISSDRDCAREDRLTLFIPYERLDAARFDGLTLILRDVSYDQRINQTTVYDERAVYIPPNYIEGFKQGASIP